VLWQANSSDSVGINGEEDATRWTPKLGIDAVGGGDRRPTRMELLSFLEGDTLQEVDEFRTRVAM